MKEGGALMHVYVWEHKVSLYYRTAYWMFTKLGGDEVIMAHALRLFGQICPEVDPRRRKNGSIRGPFSKGLILQIWMQQQQTECILVSWIEILWLFAVRTDFTNLTVMLLDLLRNLTFNRSAHCTQVSDQCPLGLLLNKKVVHCRNYCVCFYCER